MTTRNYHGYCSKCNLPNYGKKTNVQTSNHVPTQSEAVSYQ